MNRAVKTLALFGVFVLLFTVSRHVASQRPLSSTTTTTVVASTTQTALCQGTDFTAVDDGGQAAQGTAFDAVTLTKSSTGSCRTVGYPSLTMQDLSGATVPVATVANRAGSGLSFPTAAANAAPAPVTLTAGATVTFSYAFSDRSATTCPSVKTVNVQLHPGGSTVPVTLQFNQQVCGTVVTVSPLYAG